MRHLTAIAAFFALVISITGCQKEDRKLDKVYSRELTLEKVEDGDMEAILNGIARATNTSVQDIRKDADGNDMFLYSNDNVVVFVRRKFDEVCGAQGCSWKVDVSPTGTALPEASQKKVVDEAFASMAGADGIESHLSVPRRH